MRREWKGGDVVRLDLEMAPQRLFAHPAIRADNGRVTLRRGPLLYCCEAVDNYAPLGAICVPRETAFSERFEPNLLDGVVTLSAEVQADTVADWGGALYRSIPSKRTPTTLKAVPYFAWDNREPGKMSVWLRDAEWHCGSNEFDSDERTTMRYRKLGGAISPPRRSPSVAG